jgi:hypothetical protein
MEIEMNRLPAVGQGRMPRMPLPPPAISNGGGAFGHISDAEHALVLKFRDLQPQMDQPSYDRMCHDILATDSRVRYTGEQLPELFIEGPGSMDPDRDIGCLAFERIFSRLESVLHGAYTDSPTFRRLFNHAADTHLRDTRWLLAADEAFGTTVTAEQRAAAGNRAVIALNGDPFEEGGDLAAYICADGAHPFSGMRSYIHEIIHALTGLTDAEANHPRGAVVEYENIILKELGEDSPARIAYADVTLQAGVEEVDFDSIDFGGAFSDVPPR